MTTDTSAARGSSPTLGTSVVPSFGGPARTPSSSAMSHIHRGSPLRPSTVVAIVSWNNRELLADCLEALADDARTGIASVWVVDNGSTDGSVEMVRDRFPWVTLEVPEENLGFGAGVNRVARKSDSDWIVAANADIRVSPR